MEINTETVKLIGLLNELAERSKEGICPFSTAEKKRRTHV